MVGGFIPSDASSPLNLPLLGIPSSILASIDNASIGLRAGAFACDAEEYFSHVTALVLDAGIVAYKSSLKNTAHESFIPLKYVLELAQGVLKEVGSKFDNCKLLAA